MEFKASNINCTWFYKLTIVCKKPLGRVKLENVKSKMSFILNLNRPIYEA